MTFLTLIKNIRKVPGSLGSPLFAHDLKKKKIEVVLLKGRLSIAVDRLII